VTKQVCVIGVDGGNTKTVAVVADSQGSVIGVGRGGCTDVYGTAGEEGALAELTRTVEAALAAAGRQAGDLEAGVFSLAGADWPEDHELLRRHVARSLNLGFGPQVVNDAIGAIRLASPTWEGIAVICGTGNAVGARRASGEVFHVGFWPDPIGSIALSRAALNAVYRDHLELGPPTSLTARALSLFGGEDPLDLLHYFTRRGGAGRSELVRMSEVLLTEADAGDQVARDLVLWAGDTLGAQGAVSGRRVGLTLDGVAVVLGGGLFRHPSMLLQEAVMARLPGAMAVRPTVPPVVGATMLALDRIGAAADAEVIGRHLAAAG
jgi:N-acetylglucosamine kinase-like BadF-type ATPase